MPAARIPRAEVLKMIDLGVGLTEIRRHLEKTYGITCTHQAIANIRARSGRPSVQARHQELLPWRVANRDACKYIPTMLRLESRRRKGEILGEKYMKALKGFLKGLEENNVVIHYEEHDPTGQGWYYFPREEYDTDIIRDPSRVK